MVDENGVTHGIMLALIPAWLEHGRMPTWHDRILGIMLGATIEFSSAGGMAVPTQQISSREVSTSRKLTRVTTEAFAVRFVCRLQLTREPRRQSEESRFHCGAACEAALATKAWHGGQRN